MTQKFLSVQVPSHLKTPFQVCFLVSSGLTLFLLVSYLRLQPTVPLFYSLADPSDYLVDKQWLILFPVISFAITFGHSILIKTLYHHEKIIPNLFAWSTVAIQVLLTLELVRIVIIIS